MIEIDQPKFLPAALTLLFAPGQRPDAQAIYHLTGAVGHATPFSVSLCPEPSSAWLELLVMGLTYDLSGLAPADPADAPAVTHHFGIAPVDLATQPEAVRLVPGPHLITNRAMLPVIRILAALGAELASLPGLQAVVWDAAASAMAPDYFAAAVKGWLAGGAFPAFGLTGWARADDGALCSQGLALFTGYELVLARCDGESAADHARFAARIIHHVVQSGEEGLAGLQDAKGRSVTPELTSDGKVFLARHLG